MRNYIEGIPHSHREMSSGTFRGITDRGLPFDLEVVREEMPLSTNGYARRMMEMRLRAVAEARAAGKPLGVDHGVSYFAPEEMSRITFRMNVGGQVRRVEIRINPDGSYSALSGRHWSLRAMVRDVACSLEGRMGLAPARFGM